MPGINLERLDTAMRLYGERKATHPVMEAIARLDIGEHHTFSAEDFNGNHEGMFVCLVAWQNVFGWFEHELERNFDNTYSVRRTKPR